MLTARTRLSVLLVDPIALSGDNVEGGRGRPNAPHIGLFYLGSYLLARHSDEVASVKIIEMGALDYTYDNVLERIENYGIDLVGITAKTFNITGAFELAHKIKEFSREIMVILGGAHATALSERSVEECKSIDAAVAGEGELTLGEIAGRFYASRDIVEAVHNVAGATCRDVDGKAVTGPVRSFVRDLDYFPPLDFSLVDFSLYRKMENPLTKQMELRWPIFWSRGCCFDCSFCMSNRKLQVRSPENCADEVSRLYHEHGIRSFIMQGGGLYSFVKDKKSGMLWYERFCDLMDERKIKAHWTLETRIDASDKKFFERMRDIGCIQVGFGIESGSEEVLRKNSKPLSRAMIKQRVAEAKEAGIFKVRANFILGLPYDTRQTVEETISLIAELPLDNVGIGIFDVYPGTTVFDMVGAGEGGTEWLQDFKLNWEIYNRASVHATVNDLSKEDLLRYKDIARAVHDSRVEIGHGGSPLFLAAHAMSKHRDSLLRLISRNSDQKQRYKQKINTQKTAIIKLTDKLEAHKSAFQRKMELRNSTIEKLTNKLETHKSAFQRKTKLLEAIIKKLRRKP